MTWQTEMASICEKAKFLSSYNVAEVEFTGGDYMEVYFAITPEQRKKGLAFISELDLSGMLFVYDSPTYVPYSMTNTLIDLSVAWYDQSGTLIQDGTFGKLTTSPLTCPIPFTYVLEVPAGTLPAGNIKLRKD